MRPVVRTVVGYLGVFFLITVITVVISFFVFQMSRYPDVDYGADMQPGAVVVYRNEYVRIVKIDALCVRESWSKSGQWTFKESGPCDGLAK